MVKIVIYDDTMSEIIARYSCLTHDHEVHVFLLDDLQLQKNDSDLEWEIKQLENAGFKKDNIYCKLTEKKLEAELYFLDGLYGKFFDIAKHLPKEKVYLNSGNLAPIKEAKDQGYSIVWDDQDIPDIAMNC